MTQPPTTSPSPAAETENENPHEQDLDRKAYEAYTAALAALTQTKRLNSDLSNAATIAIQAANAITPEMRATFAKMPAEFFDPAHLADFGQHGRAARFIVRKLRQARVIGDDTQRRLPALVDSTTTVRARMLRVLEYNVGDQPLVARQLDAIRAGNGYEDLANDLDDVADLYETYAQTLARDAVHYAASDVALARDCANKITEQLDLQRREDITLWTNQQSRIWTLLSHSYGETQRTARYIWPNDKAILDLFPPLRVTSAIFPPVLPPLSP